MHSPSRFRSLNETTSVVGKIEQMLGSFGPHPEGKPHEGKFEEESPAGMVARSGTYHARSRVVDDDGAVYAGLFSTVIKIAQLTYGVLRLGVVIQTRQGVVNEEVSSFYDFTAFVFLTLWHHLHFILA